MYFPYLRGKQFELIALRELSVFMASKSEKISPIIEPVKDSSTLKTTLSELVNQNINFNFILNPRVGNFINSFQNIVEILKENTKGYTNFQIGIIVDKTTENGIAELLAFKKNLSDLSHNGFTLIHTSEIGKKNLDRLNSELNIKYNLIYFSKTSRRYYREFQKQTRVSLDDYFRKLDTNSDYLAVPVSDFSEEYKFYKEDGFVGFSDFLTIGDYYSESGFLPRAVAIHLSYIESDKIKVRHFTSDSNQDSSDIGGKFAEALQKLIDWCEKEKITETEGIKIFKELHSKGHFPGLGSLKKISTINHIELVVNNI